VSPQINPVFNISPTISSRQTETPRESQAQVSRPQRVQQGPNIIFTRSVARKITVTEDDLSNVNFMEDRGQGKPDAIVACFRNEPDISRRVSDAEYVKAQIIYRNKEQHEIEDGVPAACWVGSSLDMVHLRVGETHCVLLGFLDENGALFVPWRVHRHQWDGDTIEMVDKTFIGVASIEVRLIGENNELLLLPKVFDFSVVNGQPFIAGRQDT
jgi:hypothetical protein